MLLFDDNDAALDSGRITKMKRLTIIAKDAVQKEGRILKGRAIVYDEDDRPVAEFSSIFKIAKDAQIKGISFGSGGEHE